MKSIVPTTGDRCAGSATNGVAYGTFSAQVYSREDESAVRPAAQSRPPSRSIHSTCSAISSRVATAGVLLVWNLAELLMAAGSDSEPGRYRPLAAIAAARSSAAGDIRAIHSPPSDPKHFCGAK